MSSTEPLVSVLIPVYNGQEYIAQAVESILRQSLSNLELILINDGSTDDTQAILDRYQKQDARVRLYTQENQGIVPTLNRGIELARGRFLARLDADDYCFTNRLERQVAVLERDSDVVMVGSAFYLLSADQRSTRIVYPPASDTEIHCALLLDNPFAQSSVTMRLSTLREHHIRYDPNFPLSEDYDLWSRLLSYGKGMNLIEPLVVRRMHSSQVSEANRQACIENAVLIAQRNLRGLGFDLNLDSVRVVKSWFRQRPSIQSDADVDRIDTMFAIFERLSRKPGLDPAQVNQVRARFILRLTLAHAPGSKNFSRKIGLVRSLKPDDVGHILQYLIDRQSVWLMRAVYRPRLPGRPQAGS